MFLGASLADGVRRVDEWRLDFSEMLVQSDHVSVSSTFSAGVVAWQPGEAPEALIHRADIELYAAKNAGRNRVSAPGNWHAARS